MSSPPHRYQRAFSLVELIVVIGIIAFLIGLLFPALSGARQAALRTQCASNLRQIGYAFQSYANDNRGWIPRDCTLGRADREPWMLLIGRHLGQRRGLVDSDLPRVALLQCPSHPMTDIPTAYVINAFAFESDPHWSPDGPIRITAPAHPSELPWVLEAADEFTSSDGSDNGATIFGLQYHDCYAPDHLPRGPQPRLSDDRHAKRTANVLYLDSHVSVIRRGELKIEMFDDGVRKRATEFPMTEF